ncbi:hypothetical protein [Corynebacterium sputi]|uniref:hypothetical protein n=1 Tax=Corynebacterium sputi TaxID=489915 RepID=UPI0012EC089E|nr:hypothetical protein [Corynebacterium sputi]
MTTDHRMILLETIHEHREEAKAELLLARKAYLNPVPGSPRYQDLQWIHGRDEAHHSHFQFLSDSAFNEVLLKCAAIDQYIDAIAHLVEVDRLLPIPTLALLRSVQEALLGMYWCAAEGESTEARMGRFAALILGNRRDVIPARKLAPNSAEDHANAENTYLAVQRYLEEVGFTMFRPPNKEKIRAVEFEGAKTNLEINITETAENMDKLEKFPWMLGSGATHSRSWFTSDLRGTESEIYTMYLPVLFTSLRSISAIGKYVGISNDAFEECVMNRISQAYKRLQLV